MFSSTRQLVTLQELARHLRVPMSWLRREADAGRVPHIAAGSQRLFHLASVEEVLAARAAGRKENERAP
jgi:excisionase family DNA binding protein